MNLEERVIVGPGECIRITFKNDSEIQSSVKAQLQKTGDESATTPTKRGGSSSKSSASKSSLIQWPGLQPITNAVYVDERHKVFPKEQDERHGFKYFTRRASDVTTVRCLISNNTTEVRVFLAERIEKIPHPSATQTHTAVAAGVEKTSSRPQSPPPLNQNHASDGGAKELSIQDRLNAAMQRRPSAPVPTHQTSPPPEDHVSRFFTGARRDPNSKGTSPVTLASPPQTTTTTSTNVMAFLSRHAAASSSSPATATTTTTTKGTGESSSTNNAAGNTTHNPHHRATQPVSATAHLATKGPAGALPVDADDNHMDHGGRGGKASSPSAQSPSSAKLSEELQRLLGCSPQQQQPQQQQRGAPPPFPTAPPHAVGADSSTSSGTPSAAMTPPPQQVMKNNTNTTKNNTKHNDSKITPSSENPATTPSMEPPRDAADPSPGSKEEEDWQRLCVERLVLRMPANTVVGIKFPGEALLNKAKLKHDVRLVQCVYMGQDSGFVVGGRKFQKYEPSADELMLLRNPSDQVLGVRITGALRPPGGCFECRPDTGDINVIDAYLMQRQREACQLLGPGPRTLIVGPTDSGKSTLCRELQLMQKNAWANERRNAQRAAPTAPQQSVVVDLDPGQQSIGAAGSIAATTLDDTHAIFLGEVSVQHTNAQSYLDAVAALTRLIDLSAADVSSAKRIRHRAAGWLINTMGWIEGLGYNLLLALVDVCSVDTMIVTGGDEKFWAKVQSDVATKTRQGARGAVGFFQYRDEASKTSAHEHKIFRMQQAQRALTMRHSPEHVFQATLPLHRVQLFSAETLERMVPTDLQRNNVLAAVPVPPLNEVGGEPGEIINNDHVIDTFGFFSLLRPVDSRVSFETSLRSRGIIDYVRIVGVDHAHRTITVEGPIPLIHRRVHQTRHLTDKQQQYLAEVGFNESDPLATSADGLFTNADDVLLMLLVSNIQLAQPATVASHHFSRK